MRQGPGSAYALIGCGRIADAHTQEIQRIQTAKLVAVCDRELLMGEQLATRFAIPSYYDDVGRMLEAERPDVVHILTPPGPHLALARKCLAAGCHVLVEKPVALNAADTHALIQSAREFSRKLTVGYIYLFDAAALRLKHLALTGQLGNIVHIESFYGYDLAGPYGSALARDREHWVHKLPGKLLQNTIDHLLNKIVDLAPDATFEVDARGWAASEAAREFSFVDELRVRLRSEGVSAYATFSAHIKPLPHLVRVYGTRQTATADLTSSTIRLEVAPRLPTALGRLTPPFESGWRSLMAGTVNLKRFVRSDFHFFAGLNELLRRFYTSILTDSEPPIPYGSIQKVGVLMDEVFAQAPQNAESP